VQNSNNPSGPPAAGLQTGQVLELDITDIAFGGEGVGRVHDFVVFVPFVAPGDRARVGITEVRKQFARARLLEVLRPGPQRVEPQCPHFGRCGGCQYQHLDYALQLQIKRRQVREHFVRIGGFVNPPVAEVIPCPQPYHYRNRIMVRSQWNGAEKRLIVGFLRHDNRWVEEIDECAIAEPALNQQLKEIHRKPPPKGGIKVTLRVMPDDWVLPRDSFFQNNFHLLPKLVETVRARLRLAGSRFLIDAYCGVGFFAIELAGLVERFAGVEIDQMAIRAARENARNRHIENGEFITAATEEWLPDVLKRFPREQTTVILDPPRVGCVAAAIDQLRAAQPAQILYVSCHPATLARDLQRLGADGEYRLEQVIPHDMFPQTQHVECVADLRLVGDGRSAGQEQSP
jgi:tRNA/tmRNA/rRNA uracil-C5-methylase (TrmA/RlmC/RlmD family)